MGFFDIFKSNKGTRLFIISGTVATTALIVFAVITMQTYKKSEDISKLQSFSLAHNTASTSTDVELTAAKDYSKFFNQSFLQTYESTDDIENFIFKQTWELDVTDTQLVLFDDQRNCYTIDSITKLREGHIIKGNNDMFVDSFKSTGQSHFIFAEVTSHDGIIGTSAGNPVNIKYTAVTKKMNSILNNFDTSYENVFSKNSTQKHPVNNYFLDIGGNELYSTIGNPNIDQISARDLFSDTIRDEMLGEAASNEVKKALDDGTNFYARFSLKGQDCVVAGYRMTNIDLWSISFTRLGDISSASSNSFHLIVVLVIVFAVVIIAAAVVTFLLIYRSRFNQRMLQKEEDANRHLERASRAKTSFLFNMSHDIRTPMNAIIGFTEIAEKNYDDPEKVKNALNKVRTSSEHLLSLINNILDMSRIESGKAEITVEKLDIVESLNKLDDMLVAYSNTKSVNYKMHIGDINHKYLKYDLLHVNQVLLNVVTNGIKYTPKGGNVDFFVEELEDEIDDYAKFKFIVKDNGIGMSTEFQKHLFESFSREKNSTVSKIEGTGLGLSIAKGLVDLMDGDIQVQSELEKGTTFTIIFPFEICDGLEEETEEDLYNDIDLKGKKILIVEDNELNREITRDILQENGFETDEAENGQIAIDKLTQFGPNYFDVILMDIQMPVLNGYETTRIIRKMYPFDHIPIIAFSANAFEEDKKKSLEAGMDDHQSKPVVIPELMKSIKKLLKK